MARGGAWWWILAGVAILAAVSTGGVVAVAYWKQSQLASKWLPFLADAESYYGIPTDLLARIAYQESHFRQEIIDGTEVSSAGGLGIMQLEPFNDQYHDAVLRPTPFSDQDTQDQIEQAARYLVSLKQQLGTWTLAVAGYDAGPGNVQKYHGVPPFKETQDYVAGVTADVPAIRNA